MQDESLRITYDNAERLMVTMQIIEAAPTATELLSLKEGTRERFRHLPADHQATLLLRLDG